MASNCLSKLACHCTIHQNVFPAKQSKIINYSYIIFANIMQLKWRFSSGNLSAMEEKATFPRREKNFEFYGRHLLLDFSGCRIDLNDLERIKTDMLKAVAAVGATVVSALEHRFAPQGVSVLLMLSESHASVHTYPEHDSCFLDIFTCGRDLPVELFGEVLAEL